MENPNELIIPGLRAHMGDWVYYVTFLRMEQIADSNQHRSGNPFEQGAQGYDPAGNR